MKLSVVTPLYQSAPYLSEFYTRCRAAAEAVTSDYEIIFVNDGSPDDSLALAVAFFQADERVKVIDLSRNFGQHKAMMTGLAHAQGEWVFLIDCDLEINPSVLPEFYKFVCSKGADVAFGVQDARQDGLARRFFAEAFYLTFNWLSEYPLPRNLTTARLMSRRYVQALIAHQEREVLIGGLWVITGFRQLPIPVSKAYKGSTSYNLYRRIGLMVNAVTSFSNRPLVLIFYMGSLISLLAGAAAGTLLFRRLFFGELLAGWPSLIVSIWLLGGLTIFCLGIIGIYLAKVFTETKQRPYTIVREIYEHR